MGNQEENQREKSLNLKDQKIVATMGNQGMRRNIDSLGRTMKKITKKEARRKMW